MQNSHAKLSSKKRNSFAQLSCKKSLVHNSVTKVSLAHPSGDKENNFSIISIVIDSF
jgi:hypothetical protein